jgi:hypothetical protein
MERPCVSRTAVRRKPIWGRTNTNQRGLALARMHPTFGTMGAVETLEHTLQHLHELGKRVEFSWLWDGGVDVKAGEEERNFPSVAEVLPWLQHWYGLKRSGTTSDALETELQKMYDSEINVAVRTGGGGIFVALGNDFTGFDMEGEVSKTADVLPWLRSAIHELFPMSKYDVEGLGGTSTPQMAQNGR